ncbi:MAG: DoxX family protein [Flammeovirgaceae bacterium]|nr:DoxX family protein [Flammeovirgaceae bacterium]
MKIFKLFTILLMSIFYVRIGVHHFLDPEYFLNIMPPFLPYHLELVYISGFFEILLGLLLIFPKYRFYASWGLIILLIAVFPANIYLAQSEIAQQGLDVSKEVAIWRLPFQALFIGLAYWHSKK